MQYTPPGFGARAGTTWMVLACLAALGCAAPARADAMLGVYVDWGSPYGRESNVEAFEQWLGRPIPMAMDYFDGSGWQNFDTYAGWAPGYWAQYGSQHNLSWSIPLTMGSTTLAQVAAGAHDSDFRKAASAIAAAQPDAVIRLGWEMNGNWFAWSSAGHDQDYIDAFRRVAAIFKAASSSFQIDWCPSIGTNSDAPVNAYPGDDVVDIIGMDIYDKNSAGGRQVSGWDAYLNGAYGLEWQAAFAAQHGKPMSFPEWGVGDSGDNPYFVEQMSSWIQSHNVLYDDYWNTNADSPDMLTDGHLPQSAAQFRALFAPEPGSLALLAVAAGGLLLRRRHPVT